LIRADVAGLNHDFLSYGVSGIVHPAGSRSARKASDG
jgi:hypothetical protein